MTSILMEIKIFLFNVLIDLIPTKRYILIYRIIQRRNFNVLCKKNYR